MKLYTILLIVSCVGMLASLLLWLTPEVLDRGITSAIYALSTILLTILMRLSTPVSSDVVVRRLYTQQTIGCVMFIVSALFMLNQHYHWLLMFIRNEWIVAFAIACVFFVYSSFRLSNK